MYLPTYIFQILQTTPTRIILKLFTSIKKNVGKNLPIYIFPFFIIYLFIVTFFFSCNKIPRPTISLWLGGWESGWDVCKSVCDGEYTGAYLGFSRSVAYIQPLILPSPFINHSQKRSLAGTGK